MFNPLVSVHIVVCVEVSPGPQTGHPPVCGPAPRRGKGYIVDPLSLAVAQLLLV